MRNSKNQDDSNLYQVLQLNKDCDDKAIKKAYYKLALQLHPDKQSPNLTQEENDSIKLKFQKIGFAYSILSDKEKRTKYDKTGSTEEISCLNSYESWSDYFNGEFGELVTKESIEAFSKEYKNSNEEKSDVIKSYTLYNGNMNEMLKSIILSECEDEDRFIKMIEDSIMNKEVEDYPMFKKTTTKKARITRLNNEKKRKANFNKQHKASNKNGKGSNKDGNEEDNGIESATSLEALAMQIQAKNKRRAELSDDFFDNLIKKYK